MSTRVQHVELLDALLHGRISTLSTEIRHASALSAGKRELRAEKAALLAARAGEIPDSSLPAVRTAISLRAVSLTQSLRRAENPAFKQQLRQELDETDALRAALDDATE
jgi:hypothetical protein